MNYDRDRHRRELESEVVDEPDYTCPKIDSVIEWCEDITKKMEEIRAANIAIRDWGEDWKQKAIELSMELEKVTDDRDSKENDIKVLQLQISNLEETVKNLENDIKEAANDSVMPDREQIHYGIEADLY